jgi:KDO2-lipid IV(A) lauroyltransferase
MLQLLIRLTGKLPLYAAHALGAALGRIAAGTDNRLSRAAQINIARCLPAWTTQQRATLFRRTMVECGRTAAEIGFVCHRPIEQVLGLVREVSGEESVAQLLASQRGLVVASPHLGAWELAGLYGAGRLLPMTIMQRRPKSPALAALITRCRSRTGAQLVNDDLAGLRALYRTLQGGGNVGLLPDQDPGRRGVFAPFFGVPASTTTLVQRLLRATDAALVLCYAERLPASAGYRVHFEPGPVRAADADPLVAATALNEAVERCAMRLPEQYQWCYKRFKTRPAGDGEFYR